MAIVSMSKFNLLALKKHKEDIVHSLQKFSEIYFKEFDDADNMVKYTSLDKTDTNSKLIKLEKIIKLLSKYEKQKSLMESLTEDKIKLTYDELLQLEKDSNFSEKLSFTENLFEEYDNKKKQIEDLKHKLKNYEDIIEFDITQQDMNSLKKVKSGIFTISKKDYDEFTKKDIFTDENRCFYVEIIGSSKLIYTFISIKKDKYDETMFELKKYGFMEYSINLEKSVSSTLISINENIEILKRDIKELEHTLSVLADKDLIFFKKMYEALNNYNLKEESKEKFILTDECFVIKGYIPENRKEEFEELLNKKTNNNKYIEYEIVEDIKDIPIKLKNNKLVERFELLTSIYSMPKYDEVDPTSYLAPFFWFFFGMMIGDAGYGAVLLLASALGLYVFKLDASMNRLLRLFFVLSFGVILWGIIYGTYFGYEFYPIISITTSYNEVLKYSIVFGIIHVFFGIFLKGVVHYKNKRYIDIVYDCVFWYICLISTILLLASSTLNLSATATSISKIVMIASMLGIIATGGREFKNVGGRIGFGVYALYGITGYFGDFISYARLMALGLSGAFMSLSINNIVKSLSNGYITFIFAIIVFIMAHFMNLFLSTLGSYVHTSRLIYVEFFGKFYEGSGLPFKDFKTKSKYYEIEEN